jgi:hypothetical protein
MKAVWRPRLRLATRRRESRFPRGVTKSKESVALVRSRGTIFGSSVATALPLRLEVVGLEDFVEEDEVHVVP